MTDTIYTEGWLIRSRERGMHFPPFKSKWVRRYFVLRVLDRNLGTYVLDEFRKDDKRRLRKSLDLTRCVQLPSRSSRPQAVATWIRNKWTGRKRDGNPKGVAIDRHLFHSCYHPHRQFVLGTSSRIRAIDSHLQLADSSCSTTSRFGGFQWIFSLYFTKGVSSHKKTPLYFVSESEERMKDWVYNLCRACRLEKETDEDNNPYMQQQLTNVEVPPSHRSTLPSSVAGLSIYSDRSSESMLDTPRSEVSRDFELVFVSETRRWG
ncbi:hypothetical protein Y032_0029g1992 [Ancylostoma ceylanicum]|uniref:PH domain-containing protein n=1 Tax=Ancylostoma ceylanicum TaxID=53326 RepID=A0A016UST7_9BILA|nr:hypothetical protein Y032_0029g1992 [Ancylostoma ceylanicum]